MDGVCKLIPVSLFVIYVSFNLLYKRYSTQPTKIYDDEFINTDEEFERAKKYYWECVDAYFKCIMIDENEWNSTDPPTTTCNPNSRVPMLNEKINKAKEYVDRFGREWGY